MESNIYGVGLVSRIGELYTESIAFALLKKLPMRYISFKNAISILTAKMIVYCFHHSFYFCFVFQFPMRGHLPVGLHNLAGFNMTKP